MCTISMVYDHYNPLIPDITRPSPTWPWPSVPPPVPVVQPAVTFAPSDIDWAALRQLISDFKAARDAAKVVDAKTGQPDCADPAKATLDERVAALEARLAALDASGGPGGRPSRPEAAAWQPEALASRVSAELRAWAASGLGVEEIWEQYPWLKRADVESALREVP